MLNSFLRGILVALILSTGCVQAPIAREVRIYRPGETNTRTSTAPFDGRYVLVREPGKPHSQGLLQADLREGDPVGFRVLASGEIEAVAGARAMVIEQVEHLWMGTPEKGDLNVGKTIATTAIVIGIVAALVIVGMALGGSGGIGGGST